MDNIFIKEVINGKLITIYNVNFFDMIKLNTLKCNEEYKILHLFSEKVTIDNKKLSPEDFGNLEDFEIIGFISESINQITKNRFFNNG